MGIKIDYNKCDWKAGKCDCNCECNCNKVDGGSCGCVGACSVNAITRKDKVIINKKKCILCGACVKVCPNKALSFF